MRCPWCPAAGSRRQLHRHLADTHGDMVKTVAGEAGGPMQYVIGCPRCGGEIRHEVKPRWGDAAFLTEFEPEIRLVAFDLLLYHLEDAHPDDVSEGLEV